MDESSESVRRYSQRTQRINYHLLNDGSDEEAPLEDRIAKRPRLLSVRHSIKPITPDDSSSHRTQTRSPSLQIAQENVFVEDQQPSAPSLNGEWEPRRKKTQNQNLWAEFDVFPLEGKLWWPKRGKGPLEDREIKCKRCRWQTTDSARATSTSNMIFHLTKHGIFPSGSESCKDEDKMSSMQPSISSFFEKRAEQNKIKRFEQNLLRWIVTDNMAFDSIESPEFMQIFQDLDISLPLNSRKTVARRIDTEFDLHREQLRHELDTTCQTIALSLDAWTSKNSKAILGVIGHWLTNDFQYRERVLEFTEISGAHSGENMADLLQKMLEELRLEDKLLAITADNASANETMVSELYFSLREKFGNADSSAGQKKLRFQGVDGYVRCTAHVLNLIVGDILSTLKAGDHSAAMKACDLMQEDKDIGPQSALARLRIMPLWIARTPQRKQQWKLICQSHRLKDKFIEYDVDTRWNSAHRMLRDALNAKQQVKKWVEHQTSFPPFSEEDWDRLQQINRILAKFEDFTLTVSKRQPQISLAIPIYYEVHDLLHDAASREGEFSDIHAEIAGAASAGLKKYQKYYGLMDEQDAYYVALVLDPRFKTLLLEKELGKVTAPKIIRHVKELLHEQYSATPSPSEPAREDGMSQRRSIEARVLQKLQPQKQRLSDIDRYFEDGIVTVDDSVIDEKNWLLTWWRTHSDEYPRLAAAARDYLAIPASGVSVERLFNGGRDLLGVRRNSLSGETMRHLALLRDIYKSEGTM